MLHSEEFSALRPLEKFIVDDENYANVESAWEVQCYLQAGNVYTVNPLFELHRQSLN
jgi:hypothetical protein